MSRNLFLYRFLKYYIHTMVLVQIKSKVTCKYSFSLAKSNMSNQSQRVLLGKKRVKISTGAETPVFYH
jgi:hypothetical protein